MKEVVIYEKFGGLGDSLFLTPIPRLLKEQDKETKVYVSSQIPFRSSEIRHLVWELNPYVDGFVDSAPQPPLLNISKPSGGNLLTWIACAYGLDVNNPLEPEIYYTPKKIAHLSEKVLVDLNYFSYVGAISHKKINAYLRAQTNLIFVNPPDWVDPIGEIVRPTSLADYTDHINSCKKFLTLTSGGATLAASIKKNAVCFYGFGQDKIFHHSELHEYLAASPGKPLAVPMSYILRARNKIRHAFSRICCAKSYSQGQQM